MGDKFYLVIYIFKKKTAIHWKILNSLNFSFKNSYNKENMILSKKL